VLGEKGREKERSANEMKAKTERWRKTKRRTYRACKDERHEGLLRTIGV